MYTSNELMIAIAFPVVSIVLATVVARWAESDNDESDEETNKKIVSKFGRRNPPKALKANGHEYRLEKAGEVFEGELMPIDTYKRQDGHIIAVGWEHTRSGKHYISDGEVLQDTDPNKG